jgi:tetratricopeptide (TPR) repeat protein
MKRKFSRLIIVTASLFWAATSHAQAVGTQAPCSPVVDRTQGNVTLTFNGGCTVGIAPAELKDIIEKVLAGRATPPEWQDRYDLLSRTFGVTDTALTTFFRILGEQKVPTEDLDAKLREVAAQHLTLLKQAEVSPGDDPQVAAMKKQALAAIDTGDYGRAEGLLQRADDVDLAAARRTQDAANKLYLAAAKTRANIAQLKLTQLRYAAAAEDFQEAANRVPSGELLVRSAYLNSLGEAALSAGSIPLASTALTEALTIRERLLGPEHPDVASSLDVLAFSYRIQTRYAEAASLRKRALAITEKALGPEHPKVASRLILLAVLYDDQGRYAESEPLYKRALAIDEKALGPDDPEVAISLDNLARLYSKQRRLEEAEPLYKRALSIVEKAHGPGDPGIVVQLNNLALFYAKQGRVSEVEPLLKRAISIIEKHGPDDPVINTYLSNLAGLYRDQERYAEAEPLLKRALAITEKALGPEHPKVASQLDKLAHLYQAKGDFAEAEPLYRRALAIYEKTLGPKHPNTIAIRENLGLQPDTLAGSNGVPSDRRPGNTKRQSGVRGSGR